MLGHVFPPAVRFTGVALGCNLGTMLGSATSPLIAAALLVLTGSWIPVAVYLSLGALIALGAAFGLRERYAAGAERSVCSAGGPSDKLTVTNRA